jgi:hypothetical protein
VTAVESVLHPKSRFHPKVYVRCKKFTIYTLNERIITSHPPLKENKAGNSINCLPRKKKEKTPL